MSVIRTRMCGPEEAVVGPSEECVAPRSSIDEIMTRRIACRDFSDAPVPRRMIEQILHVARYAPSGANIQPLEGWLRPQVSPGPEKINVDGVVRGVGSGRSV